MDLLNKKASIGNTFNKGEVVFGHARKVWREQREVLPAGGVITNVEDFVPDGVIPSGRPVIFDDKEKKMVVLTVAMVKSLADAESVENFDATKTYAVGDMVKKDSKIYECIEAIEEAAAWDATKWQEVSIPEVSLSDINGYLKEDAPLADENTVATGTVVVDGDIYEYMFDDDEAAILKALPQKNGMKIRFVN
jgi:hypothetical protein